MNPRDNRFNTPSEMFARFVFVARFFLFLVGLVFSIFAVLKGSGLEASKAAGFFIAMLIGHAWLKRTGRLEACDRSLETMFQGGANEGESEHLEALLQRRDALEQKRGTAGFDPWAFQAVRREINDYVREHPEFQALLDGRQ